jgi:hypothetical protein
VVIVAKNVLIRVRNNQPVIKKGWRFFVRDADFFMLFGSLVLFILYVLALDRVGFLAASLVFIFLFNLLFCRTRKIKSILVSLLISVISCVSVWYLFSVVFNISLP